MDFGRLETDLRAALAGEVRFDAGSRALYSTDASNYRQAPIGVVIPKNVEDVVQGVAACRRHGAPLLPRGGGTSLAGQGCNTAVVLDFSKYVNNILQIDPHQKVARVEPGVVLDQLKDAAERYHLTFGPDPATHSHCTLGGMIGNNSCGIHSVMAGKTVDNVEELEILTYDGLRFRVGRTSDDELERIVREGGRYGQIYAELRALRDRYADLIRQRYPTIPRRVSGYNLDQLLPENGFHVARALVGTEGTCVTVLEATLDLARSPPVRVLLALGYPDVYSAGDQVPQLLAHGPIALEGLDDRLVAAMRRKSLHGHNLALLPEGGGWLLVEFGGQNESEAVSQARGLMQALRRQTHPPSMRLFDQPEEMRLIWQLRESALGALARVPGQPDTRDGWEDSAVPPESVGDYLRGLRKLYDRYGYEGALFGHFGQGCVHTRTTFDFKTREGIERFRAFLDEAAELALSFGGSLSGEHGDGQARAWLLPQMFGDELVQAFRDFKAIWDPEGKMNPGKVVDAYGVDENLRLGPDYRPLQASTHFSFPQDDGSLARATERCVGVGACRKLRGGTMCPSYMVTLDEQHSTRGRARLLFEMLRGDSLKRGWRDEHVKEALDLCLACKACKSECPVNVDMATYKAEFLAHYYAGRLRPRSAYFFGLIFYWARLGARMPALVNFFTHRPLLRDVAKAALGLAPQRQVPTLASQPFKAWFHRRASRNRGQSPVILWPDTFNNYFHPETAIAAVEVLESAGYQVSVPARDLCCGRPVYDYGMLGLGRRLLLQVLDELRPAIQAGIPLVGLEPSCVAVFRDELLNLFPGDETARLLAQQSFLLSEFLEKRAAGYQPPTLKRRAIVQAHCHHRAIMKLDAEQAVLAKMGLAFQVLDSGCCGMAGAFGFEKDHYDVSVRVGERVLLPAVRQADEDTLIIADGFSCREQIVQATGRHALHLAEVLQMALSS